MATTPESGRCNTGFKNEKAPAVTGASRMTSKTGAYLSAVCTLVKVVFSFEPRPCTTAIIATEMPAAMRPYSMAVAPDSSFTNFKRFFIFGSIGPQQWLSERGSGAVIVWLIRNRGAKVALSSCGEVNIGSETTGGDTKK